MNIEMWKKRFGSQPENQREVTFLGSILKDLIDEEVPGKERLIELEEGLDSFKNTYLTVFDEGSPSEIKLACEHGIKIIIHYTYLLYKFGEVSSSTTKWFDKVLSDAFVTSEFNSNRNLNWWDRKYFQRQEVDGSIEEDILNRPISVLVGKIDEALDLDLNERRSNKDLTIGDVKNIFEEEVKRSFKLHDISAKHEVENIGETIFAENFQLSSLGDLDDDTEYELRVVDTIKRSGDRIAEHKNISSMSVVDLLRTIQAPFFICDNTRKEKFENPHKRTEVDELPYQVFFIDKKGKYSLLKGGNLYSIPSQAFRYLLKNEFKRKYTEPKVFDFSTAVELQHYRTELSTKLNTLNSYLKKLNKKFKFKSAKYGSESKAPSYSYELSRFIVEISLGKL